MGFIVTTGWIESYATPQGGWKRRQLEQLGLTWPPPKGWKDRAIGQEITDQQRRIFEAYVRPDWHD